jgi:hypothetical protein
MLEYAHDTLSRRKIDRKKTGDLETLARNYKTQAEIAHAIGG